MKIIFVLITAILQMGYAKAQHIKFTWPLKPMPTYSEVNDYYSINNYVNQIRNAGGGSLDYNCGMRTYNNASGAHAGVDIDLWPFHWSMMENNYVAVVAAADGRVYEVDVANNNDNNCEGNTPGTWNHIYISHDNDKTLSYYGHLKNNSALVANGDSVKQGQIIAFVGSSGNSSNPHLHFEVHNLVAGNYVLIDPYSGPCNFLNTDSWWINQKPYKEPAIVRVMTHYAAPSVLDDTNLNFCRNTEDKKAKNNFNPGEQVHIGMAFRDIEQGIAISCIVFKPDGTVSFVLPFVSPAAYEKWYNTISYTLPGDAQTGTYKVVVSFQNHSSTHFFSVGCKAIETISAPVNDYSGYIAGTLINCSSSIQAGARVRLQSGGIIRLTDGFRAVQGCTVKARIKDCNYSE